MLFKSKLLDTTQTSTDNFIIGPICKFCKLAVTNAYVTQLTLYIN